MKKALQIGTEFFTKVNIQNQIITQVLHNSGVEIQSSIRGAWDNADIETFKKKYPSLPEEEQKICSALLSHIYSNMLNEICQSKNWNEFLKPLCSSKITAHAILGKYLGKFPQLDHPLLSVLLKSIKPLINELKGILQYNIQREILDNEYSFNFSDIYLLANGEILYILRKKLLEKDAVEKVDYLLDFKDFLINNRFSALNVIDFSHNEISSLERDVHGLNYSVNEIIEAEFEFVDPNKQLEKIVEYNESKDRFERTYFFENLRQEIQTLVYDKLASINDITDDDYKGLGEIELGESRKLLKTFYLRYQELLPFQYSTWNEILYQTDEASKFSYLDGYNLIGPSNNQEINISIDIRVHDFIEKLKTILTKGVQIKINRWGFCFVDIIVLTIPQIKEALSKALCQKKESHLKIEFLNSLNDYLQATPALKFCFEFSEAGRIIKQPRDLSVINDWTKYELEKLRPQFFILNSNYKDARYNQEGFKRKWEKLIAADFFEINPIENFIQSNFTFYSLATPIRSDYIFKVKQQENLKEIVIEIAKIFEVFKISGNKKEIALWLYLHLNGHLEYRTIEYYIYHR